MKFRKTVKAILAVIALFALAASVAGCGKERSVSTNVPDGEMPKELSVFGNFSESARKGGASTNNDILSFKLMEEKTGCHVTWTHPPSGGVSEKFNFMIASGSWPDAIVYEWRSAPGGVKSYADDGVIVPLTDLIDECMPNLSAYLKDHPDIKKQFTNDEGEIFYIPYIRKDKELCVYQGPQIRKDWLDKLGLDIPKTTDEFYEVLKAFKTRDPNGNGVMDEIPMSGLAFKNSSFGIGNLLWAFGTSYGMYVEDKTVKYGPLEKNFVQGLTYIAKLYHEGLIDVDYLLNDRQKVDSKVMNDNVGFLFGFQPSTYYKNMNDGVRKVEGIGYLSGPDGSKCCFNSMYTQQALATAMAITTSNPNPKGTLRWLDNFYGGDGGIYMNFGKEGETFDWVNGYPKLSDSLLNTPDQTGLTIGAMDSVFPTLQDYRYYEQIINEWGKQSIETWSDDNADTSKILPPISLTDEETEIKTKIMSQIETYVLEEIDKVVVGQSDISNWPKVCEKIKSLGIDQTLEMYNAAYKRYVNR